MVFKSLLRDNVTLIKQNGTTVKGIKASVQPKKIFIEGRKPLIETGDLVQRKMSNGAEETYEVIDPRFYESSSGMPAHYQMDVRKLGVPEAKKAVQNTTLHITGDNNQINQNTVGESATIVQLNLEVAKVIDDLKQEINRCIEDQARRSKALEVVDAIELHLKSGSLSRTVVDTLVNALPSVGNIASIASLISQGLSA